MVAKFSSGSIKVDALGLVVIMRLSERSPLMPKNPDNNKEERRDTKKMDFAKSGEKYQIFREADGADESAPESRPSSSIGKTKMQATEEE